MHQLSRLTFTIVIAALLGACASKQDRPMRASERTMLSAEVADRLDESDGYLDTREYNDIRCRRVKLTGSHMVTRHCFTLAEQEAQAEQSQDRMERIMNDTPRPRGEGRGF